jgi:hypothetical protein
MTSSMWESGHLDMGYYSQHSSEILELALRVLTAITDKCYPDPADVAALRRLAPFAGPMPVDELACELIQGVLRIRATARVAAAGS